MANNDRRCSAECPHEPHTFGGRPMQYCEGVQSEAPTAPSKAAETKGSDGFWSRHEREMRKARLLQAAATIHAHAHGDSRESTAIVRSVEVALDLEQWLEKRIRGTNGHS